MTRRRDRARRPDSDWVEESGVADQKGMLFPSLRRLAEEIQEAQDHFERLYTENRDLRGQRERQNQELARLQQKTTDLNAKCESLIQQLTLTEVELEHSRMDALVTLFRDMANERHNQLLRKLLQFEEEEPTLLRDLVQYLRDELNLALEGEVGMEITLTEENLDLYEVQDAVSLPRPAEVIGRGISFKGQPITRVQVEPIEEETSDGN
jgi:chromosome segregation ATPase